MNIQVGDIIKLKNNQPVTVSTSLQCNFFFFGLSGYRGTPSALLLPLLLVTSVCFTVHPEINGSCRKFVFVCLSPQLQIKCDQIQERLCVVAAGNPRQSKPNVCKVLRMNICFWCNCFFCTVILKVCFPAFLLLDHRLMYYYSLAVSLTV